MLNDPSPVKNRLSGHACVTAVSLQSLRQPFSWCQWGNIRHKLWLGIHFPQSLQLLWAAQEKQRSLDLGKKWQPQESYSERRPFIGTAHVHIPVKGSWCLPVFAAGWKTHRALLHRPPWKSCSAEERKSSAGEDSLSSSLSLIFAVKQSYFPWANPIIINIVWLPPRSRISYSVHSTRDLSSAASARALRRLCSTSPVLITVLSMCFQVSRDSRDRWLYVSFLLGFCAFSPLFCYFVFTVHLSETWNKFLFWHCSVQQAWVFKFKSALTGVAGLFLPFQIIWWPWGNSLQKRQWVQ